MSLQLTQAQIEELRKGFAEIDTDGNGMIVKEELHKLFVALFGDEEDVNIEASVDKAFKACDVDNDGRISFEEYVQLATAQ